MSLNRITQLATATAVLLIVGFAIASRGDKADAPEPAAKAPAPSAAANAAPPAGAVENAPVPTTRTISVRDGLGNRVQLELTDNSPVAVMATWCDKTAALVAELADPRIQPFVKDIDMVFLFKRDEWPTIDAEAAAAGNHGLYDPTMLSKLKGRVYYFDPADNIVFSGTPSFHRSGNVFDIGRGEWLYKHAKVPGEIVKAVFAIHEPDA